jgi:signal transduction histidine kinase
MSNINAGAMGKVSRKLKETFEMAGSSVDRLAKVIDDFVELSEIELGSAELMRTEIDMRNLCAEVIEWATPRMKDKKITFDVTMPEIESLITLDRARIVKVLQHLLDNAIKFVPKHGKIELHLEERGRDVAVYIKDNGPGIAPENIESIFECFSKFDAPECGGLTGLGLGLTLAKGIVEMHHGEIIVASTPGKTTTFRVVIPK